MRFWFGLALLIVGLVLGIARNMGIVGNPAVADGSIFLIALFIIPGVWFFLIDNDGRL